MSDLVVLLHQNGIKWGVFVWIGDTYMQEKFLTKRVVLFFLNYSDRVCVWGRGRHIMRE